MMRRRALGVLLGATILPATASARPRRRLAVLIVRAQGDAEGQSYLAALTDGLAGLGWSIGRDLDIDIEWLPGSLQDAVARVQTALSRRPDALVVNGSYYLRAVAEAGGQTPIVFVAVGDPVGSGFVANLPRPGGHATGFAAEDAGMGAKWVEFLKEIAPSTTTIGALYNPVTAASPGLFLKPMDETARTMALTVTPRPIVDEADLASVMDEVGYRPGSGLVVLPDAYLYARRERIAERAVRNRIPVVAYHRAFAERGVLMSYSIDRVDLFRRAARYVHLVLEGTDPGELPVQMPAKYELVINRSSVAALGLTIPPALLIRADELIE